MSRGNGTLSGILFRVVTIFFWKYVEYVYRLRSVVILSRGTEVRDDNALSFLSIRSGAYRTIDGSDIRDRSIIYRRSIHWRTWYVRSNESMSLIIILSRSPYHFRASFPFPSPPPALSFINDPPTPQIVLSRLIKWKRKRINQSKKNKKKRKKKQSQRSSVPRRPI